MEVQEEIGVGRSREEAYHRQGHAQGCPHSLPNPYLYCWWKGFPPEEGRALWPPQYLLHRQTGNGLEGHTVKRNADEYPALDGFQQYLQIELDLYPADSHPAKAG